MEDAMSCIRRWLKMKEKRDRLSELPDDILLKILFLLPAKYAARTKVLSKRWQRFWDSLSRQATLPITSRARQEDCYMFKYKNVYYPSSTLIMGGYNLDMVTDVDDVMGSLHKLILSDVIVANDKSLEKTISKCPLIQDLELSFDDGLWMLMLGACSCQPTLPVSATLKSLTLRIPNMTDEWFVTQIGTNLSDKFPVLEDLRLIKCCKLQSISISSPRLRTLSLLRCHRLRTNINLETPFLRKVEYTGHHVFSFAPTKMASNWNFLSATIILCLLDHDQALRVLQFVADFVQLNYSNGLQCRVTSFCNQRLPLDGTLSLNLSILRREPDQPLLMPRGFIFHPLIHARNATLHITMKLATLEEFIPPVDTSPYKYRYPYCSSVLEFRDLFKKQIRREVWCKLKNSMPRRKKFDPRIFWRY